MTTLVTLGLAELIARTQVPAASFDLLYEAHPDPELGVTLAANADFEFEGVTTKLAPTRIRTTAEGYREPAVLLPAPPGTRRLACLGDSVVFGWGVEALETFCAHLPQRLGPGWDAVNFGVPGYNLTQTVRRFELNGSRFHPDAVVLIVNQNDADPPLSASRSRWSRAADSSALLRWVLVRLTRSAAAETPTAATPVAPADVPSPGYVAPLTRLAGLYSRTGTPWIVVFTWPAPAALVRHTVRLGAEVLDARDILATPHYTIAGDGHPNAAGHAALADRIAERLGVLIARQRGPARSHER
ncbi:MAG: SGNH/GDSL hydrolase family protein [Myxococcales bacterium]|nr:SGNH/GDSL hydrolase family protein [Myxococcales bacterium]